VLRISEDGIADGATVVRFEISDTGVGIASETQGIIFQPFVQADTSSSRKYGGTGLGLAISGQLVALMAGDCGVSSTLGEGSTFWFTITAPAVALLEMDEPLSNDDELDGVEILVVDDNATQRSVLSDQLSGWGMIVGTAESAEDALEEMRRAAGDGRPFAVALVDRQMPGMDGLELRNAIVADPELLAEVVLMTGLGQDRDLGDFPSVTKPLHAEKLRRCLRIAVGASDAAVEPTNVRAQNGAPSGEPTVGRLLLVEDNSINQKVAVAILSSAGYCVDAVTSGAAAVRAAAEHNYDAVLMDCQMPDMNGYEATAAIRAGEAVGKTVPIIAITAGARPEDRELCLDAGMDDYLAKPVTKDALLAVVAQSLRVPA
jgi:CheY-like chemotaxis protein